jgi:hypothetical protein
MFLPFLSRENTLVKLGQIFGDVNPLISVDSDISEFQIAMVIVFIVKKMSDQSCSGSVHNEAVSANR